MSKRNYRRNGDRPEPRSGPYHVGPWNGRPGNNAVRKDRHSHRKAKNRSVFVRLSHRALRRAAKMGTDGIERDRRSKTLTWRAPHDLCRPWRDPDEATEDAPTLPTDRSDK